MTGKEMLILFHHRATEDTESTERKEKIVDKKNELSYSKYEDKKCQHMAKKAVEKEFVKIVRKKLNNRLKKIMLFGSYARGDYTDHSDYDILVVVDKREKFVQDVILDACVEIMDKYYELIGCIVCDEKEWELKKKFPIGLNILKEGIEL